MDSIVADGMGGREGDGPAVSTPQRETAASRTRGAVVTDRSVRPRLGYGFGGAALFIMVSSTTTSVFARMPCSMNAGMET